MTIEEAKKRSKDRKEQADRLLAGFPVVDMLSEYGEVKIHGSYIHDTMMKPDIDITVYSEEFGLNEALEVHNQIMKTENTKRISVANRLYKDEDDPKKGVFMKVRYMFEDEQWNIDIHFQRSAFFKDGKDLSHEIDWSGVTQEQKDYIVFLKAELMDLKLYPASPFNDRMFYSKEIFDAVVNHGVRDVESMHEWRKTNPFPKPHFD